MKSINAFIHMVENSVFVEKSVKVAAILLITFVCIKIINGAANRIFDEKRASTESEIKRINTVRKTTKNFSKVFIYILAAITIASLFIQVQSLLAVAGVGSIIISMGAKGIVEDLLSGMVILSESHFLVGDYVTIEGHYGVVETIGVRTTAIRELDGSLFIIHNGKIDRLTNYSKGRVIGIVELYVSYNQNIQYLYTIINSVCDELYEHNDQYFDIKPHIVGITAATTNAVTVKVALEEEAAKRFKAESVLRQRLIEEFERFGIQTPFERSIYYKEKVVESLHE